MKKIHNRKKTFGILLLVSVLAAAAGIGGTYAWRTWELSLNNELTPYKVEAEITEVFSQNASPAGSVTKEVSFKNRGTAPVFLRAAYVETWETLDGTYLPNQISGSDTDEIASKVWTKVWKDTSIWQQGPDGWYYYKKVLDAGKETDKILEKVVFPEYAGAYEAYAKADYSLHFSLEFVQASSAESAVNYNQVNADATKSLFGYEGSISSDNSVVWKFN